MIRATSITHSHDAAADTVTLSYNDRHRRRMAMVCDKGLEFLLDLRHATELRDGDALVLEDGRTVRVKAAPEDLMEARCTDALHLMRIAWHIGNRHLPCEIHESRLLLRWDSVIADMLEKLGAQVTRFTAPFNPEGGAYDTAHGGHAHG